MASLIPPSQLLIQFYFLFVQAVGLITDRVVSGSYNASNFNISIPVSLHCHFFPNPDQLCSRHGQSFRLFLWGGVEIKRFFADDSS